MLVPSPMEPGRQLDVLFAARSYQMRLQSAIVCGCLGLPWVGGARAPRFIQSRFPRQHGKDRTVLNAIGQVLRRRKGLVWYGFPEYAHVRRSFWDNIDPLEDGGTGRRIIEDLLPWAVENRQEMSLTFPETGSMLRAVGWDNYNALIGAGLLAAVFSESARCDPRAFAYVEPMLDRVAESGSGGLAIHITTAFGGPNNAAAVRDRTWRTLGRAYFAETLTVEDCYRDAPGEDGRRVLSPETIAAKQRQWLASLGQEGMSPEMVRQEYYNDDAGVSEGTIFGGALMLADKNGQLVEKLPVLRGVPVWTFWDLGRSDATAVWFVQIAPDGWYHVIDYLEATASDVDWWAGTLAERAQERNYRYGLHQWPPDGKQAHWGPKDTREQVGRRLLSPPPRIAPKAVVLRDQIEAGRAMFSRCKIDRTRCAMGLEFLRNWHYPWNPKTKAFGVSPVHDFSSNGASAWCTFALYAPRGALPAAGQRVALMPHEV